MRAAASERLGTVGGKVGGQLGHWEPAWEALQSGPLPSTACLTCLPSCVPERFWHCRLALNHKVLHYGDLDDNPQGEVTFESLQEKSRCMSLLACRDTCA